jgi:hypothetical protein
MEVEHVLGSNEPMQKAKCRIQVHEQTPWSAKRDLQSAVKNVRVPAKGAAGQLFSSQNVEKNC